MLTRSKFALLLVLAAFPAFADGITNPSTNAATSVTSLATTCPASGPATGAITLSGGITINAQTGTSYTVNATDCGKLITLSNAGAIALSLPQAGSAGFASAYYTTLLNVGAGPVTVTTATSTINGSTFPVVLYTGQSMGLVSDGTNWNSPSNYAVLSSSYVASNYQAPYGYFNAVAGSAPAAATAYCSPAYLLGPVTISNLFARMTTNGTSNNSYAVYNNNPLTDRPGTLFVASATNPANNTALPTAALTGGNKDFPPGKMWWCLQVNDTTARFAAQSGSANATGPAIIGTATQANVFTTAVTGISTTTGVTSFGTWPTFVGATFTELTGGGNLTPLIGFQIAGQP